MEALAPLATRAGGSGERLMEVVKLDFQVTPMRAQRFWEGYGPAVARVLAYGAKGYLMIRSELDPEHFSHISYWDDANDFDRYWLSEEMREVRRAISGLYEQPLLPSRAQVLDQG